MGWDAIPDCRRLSTKERINDMKTGMAYAQAAELESQNGLMSHRCVIQNDPDHATWDGWSNQNLNDIKRLH